MVEKGYQGRGVAFGKHQGDPFVAYFLASRSDQERSIRSNPEKGRIEIYATGDAVERILEEADFPYDAAHNLYAPIHGYHDKRGRPAAVAFNGRMSNRPKDRMERRGEHPRVCLRTTLEDFPPEFANDSRIGAVVNVDSFQEAHFNVGRFGVRDSLPFVAEIERVEDGQLFYVTLGNETTDYRKMHQAKVEPAESADALAEQLFVEVIGEKPVAALGSAVCIIKGGEFDFGVFTP